MSASLDKPMAADAVKIRDLDFEADIDAALTIFREYVTSPTVSLAHQSPELEFANLAHHYSPPKGCLLLAWRGREVLACAALRQINARHCELKRVYVRLPARGMKLGEALVRAVLDRALQAGYERIFLDVLPEFQTAQRLYERLGFQDAEAVTHNPILGTRFMAMDLR